MITGVWISPDGEELAIQFDEETIHVEDGGDSRDAVAVPASWRTLYETRL